MTLLKRVGAIAATALLLGSAPVSAQKMIGVNRDGCAAGLRAVGEVLHGDVVPMSPPILRFGKCEARNVQVTLSHGMVRFKVARATWGHGQFSELAAGRLPETMSLKLREISISKFPDQDPVWVFLAEHSRGVRGLDADLAFSFESSDNRIVLTNAAMGFQDGNSIRAAGELAHFHPAMLRKSAGFGLVLTAKSLNLSIRGTRRFGNDIVLAILDALPADSRPKNDVYGLGPALKAGLPGTIGAVMDGASLRALRRLLDSFPHPSGTANLRVEAENGIPLVALLALSGGADPAKVLAGAHIGFEYDSAARADTGG